MINTLPSVALSYPSFNHRGYNSVLVYRHSEKWIALSKIKEKTFDALVFIYLLLNFIRGAEINNKSEPFSDEKKVRIIMVWSG